MLAFRFETLGVLVYRGTISFEVMDDLVGAGVVALWDRLKGLTIAIRAEKSYPMYCEWLQWLAEQCEAGGRLQRVPAHIRERDWTHK